MATFDHNFKKKEDDLLKYFLERYSEDTKLDLLNKENQIKIVKNMEIFIINILCRIKKYFPFDDQLFSNIETLNPELFKKDKWINLKRRFPKVHIK